MKVYIEFNFLTNIFTTNRILTYIILVKITLYCHFVLLVDK